MMDASIREIDRDLNLRGLRDLLAWDLLPERSRTFYGGWLGWLEAHPGARLADWQRDRLVRVMRWMASVKAGKSTIPDPSDRNRRPPARWPRQKIAAFLSDPSLLPMSPPGRRIGTDPSKKDG